MKRVVTFGEIMVRLAPPGYDRFVQARSFNATYAGAEANVAVSLAQFGVDARFVSKLPKHEIGQAALNAVRSYGVDVAHVARGGARLGVYYLEKGASQRGSKVIYDRAGSSIAEASPSDFDWDQIFKDADWFHFTGITPALSDGCAKLCETAAEIAKAKGLTVSCDLNFRKNLWSSEKAGEVLGRIVKHVDICIANEEDAADVFGIEAADTDVITGHISREGYVDVAKQLAQRFGFKQVAITLRESLSASDNNWAAMLYDGEKAHFSRKYAIRIVDRVGGGDSFGGGLIYALLNGKGAQEALEFAVASSALKHSIEGDFNVVSLDEVNKLASGDASGRVSR